MFFGCLPCCGTTCGAADYAITAESFVATGEVDVFISGTADSQLFQTRSTEPFAMQWDSDYQFGGYFPTGSDSVFSDNYHSASMPGGLSNYRWNFNIRIEQLNASGLHLLFAFGELTNGPGEPPSSQLDLLGTYRYEEVRSFFSAASAYSNATFRSGSASDQVGTVLQYRLSDRLCIQRNGALASGYEDLFAFGLTERFRSYTIEPGPTGQCNALPLSVNFYGSSRTKVVGSTTYQLTYTGYFRLDQLLWYDAEGNAHEVSQAPFNPPAGAVPILGGSTEYVTGDGFPL